MPSWIFLVILAQFLNAIVVLNDRYIVASRVVSKPIVYTFYVGLLSAFVLVILPFGQVTMPAPETIAISLAAAVCFIFSVFFLYESLLTSNPSEVMPIVGGMAALSTFLAGSIILEEALPGHFLTGFLILILGMILISHFKFSKRSFLFLIGSGILFGLSTILIKTIFTYETLINGFFWSRMANVVAACWLLLLPGIYKAVKKDFSKSSGHKKKLILGNKILAGLAFMLILIAIKYGNTSIVNALVATQYIFLLIFALVFSKKFPEYFSEKFHKHELLHKISATLLIVIGFFVLFI